MKITEQAAIVTGAGSGLGRAMALGLAIAGAKVMLADVRDDGVKKVQQEIAARSRIGEFFVGDLSQESSAQELINLCVQKFGRLDILINNAGLRMEVHDDGVYEDWRCLRQRPTDQVPVSDWDLLMGVNLRAVYLCTHFALPHMIRQQHGVILGISSNAGHQGVAGKSAYVASKHAVEGLMKTVAKESHSHNISANAIHPGGRVNVDGRGGQEPEVVVPLVLFLAQQDRPAVTGKVIKAQEWNEGRRDF
ncbi:MAG: SDR family oxidoreductase [Deltaproteobacteria bacterium]|nr:SDR family oxidoreductase [Deltaproteobacteria bacterium]